MPDGTIQDFCIIFFIWACRRGGGIHVTFAHTIKCRRAVGLSTTMILAYSAADDRRWRNLRLAMTLILAKIISVSIPHAGSSNTTPFSRRTTHNLVSWFSRAAIFPAHRPPSRGCRARSSRFNPWLPSSCP